MKNNFVLPAVGVVVVAGERRLLLQLLLLPFSLAAAIAVHVFLFAGVSMLRFLFFSIFLKIFFQFLIFIKYDLALLLMAILLETISTYFRGNFCYGLQKFIKLFVCVSVAVRQNEKFCYDYLFYCGVLFFTAQIQHLFVVFNFVSFFWSYSWF